MAAQKHKYRAVRTQSSDGKWFPSKKEAHRYEQLLLLQKAGEIKDLQLQVKMPVLINGIKVFTYWCDFVYVDCRGVPEIVHEDVKGFRTKEYRLKKRCVEAFYGIQILET